MAFLKMSKYLVLNKEIIKKYVSTSIGNYALGYLVYNKKTNENNFIPRYIGRSDFNLQNEIIQQGVILKRDKNNNQIYTHFKFSHDTKNEKLAYLTECNNYHDFGGFQKLDNKVHPARPKNYSKNMLPCSKISCKD